jgi:hypothetical protein
MVSLVKRDHERRTGSEWLYLNSVPLAVEATYDGVHRGCGCVSDTESRFCPHDGFEAMGTLQFRKLLSHIIRGLMIKNRGYLLEEEAFYVLCVGQGANACC